MSDPVDPLSSAGISELADFVIRPPRAHYSRAELGDRNLVVDGLPAQRIDCTLINPRGLALQVSRFIPTHASESVPTVVYLHGNGSCRVESLILLPLLIPYGFSLLSFDFAGSGRSEGEYISLGVWERYDVATVVEHLVSVGVQDIVLWGHSMGAATALMYAGLQDRSPCLKGLIVDSPFASFDKLAQHLVAEMSVPRGISRKLILSLGIRAVRKIVRERAGFDVMDIDPLTATKNISSSLPTLFIHGSADAVVPFSHGELLFKNYPGCDKTWIPLEGYEHDTQRPDSCMDRAHIFLQRVLSEISYGSPLHLEALKARGNSAMISSRFTDSVLIYTEALNALSENINNIPFAQAVGEPVPELVNRVPVSTRRHSTINYLFTSVTGRRARDEDCRDSIHYNRRASEEAHLTSNTSLCGDSPSQHNVKIESSKSESASWSGRFSRQRSFRSKGMFTNLKRRVREGRNGKSKDESIHPTQRPATDMEDISSQTSSPQRRLSRRRSHTGFSSARIRIRAHTKRDVHHLEREGEPIDPTVLSEDCRGSGSTDISCFKKRHHSYNSHRKHFLRRSKPQSNKIRAERCSMAPIGIYDWNMDGELKRLALALLGNRSLARRKCGDYEGAIFDAVTSLQLDPTWIRGYLRKAAALRQGGRLQEAKRVVAEGLKRDSNHAGLMDMLHSIEDHVEMNRLDECESNMEVKADGPDSLSQTASAVAASH